MAIADQITRLKNAKINIQTSVANKGVTIPEGTPLDMFPIYIDQILLQGKYQQKTVTPSMAPQVVMPDTGYDALNVVTVEGDTELIPTNIKEGVEIFGVTGSLTPRW